jgi:hypothetical protein
MQRLEKLLTAEEFARVQERDRRKRMNRLERFIIKASGNPNILKDR